MWEKIILPYVLSDIEIKDIKIEQVQFRLFSRWGGQQNDGFNLTINGFMLDSKELVIEGALININFDVSGVQYGGLEFHKVKYGEHVLEEVFANFEGQSKKITFRDLKGKLYGGSMKGQIDLEYSHDLSYIMDIHFEGIECRKLRSINKPFFSNFSGKLSGDLKLMGSKDLMEEMSISFYAPEGGQIKAGLLLPIVANLPAQTKQRKVLDSMIKKDQFVHFKTIRGTLKNLTDKQLSGEVYLLSPALNLAPEYTFVINIDGGINQLIRQSMRFLE